MAAHTITTLSAGYIVAGDTVVMPAGDLLEVASFELYGPEVALFTSYGERYLLNRQAEVGIVGDHANRLNW